MRYLEEAGSELSPHIPLLYAKAKESSRPLELGVFQGNSTLAFMCACHEDRKRLCSCDIVDYEAQVRLRLQQAGLNGALWSFVCGSDVDPNTVGRIRKVCPSYDLIFIDTSHLRQHTIDEIGTYYTLLEPGGLMLFHDTHTDLYPGWVYEPILDFLKAHPECEMVYDSPESYGLTAFRRLQKTAPPRKAGPFASP